MEYKIKTTEITNEGVHYFKKNRILSRWRPNFGLLSASFEMPVCHHLKTCVLINHLLYHSWFMKSTE